ncbi:unnamed protein product [Lactuca saligna]|uniref:Uncharacterized protein n=1 Tax=Lactuca saligna TaxID=75948 RepID=A0AA35YFL0_LACSI|nr:unnamed protein product [Lactuca saligna]
MSSAEVEKAEPQMMAKTKLSSWQIPTDVIEQRKKQEMSGAEDGLMCLILFINNLLGHDITFISPHQQSWLEKTTSSIQGS